MSHQDSHHHVFDTSEMQKKRREKE